MVAFAHAAVCASQDLEMRARRLAGALAPHAPGRGVGFDMGGARAAADERQGLTLVHF